MPTRQTETDLGVETPVTNLPFSTSIDGTQFVAVGNGSFRIAWTTRDGRRLRRRTDGFVVADTPEDAHWLPAGWLIHYFPAGYSWDHLDAWFRLAILKASWTDAKDRTHGDDPSPLTWRDHAKSLIDHLGIDVSRCANHDSDVAKLKDWRDAVKSHFARSTKGSDEKSETSLDEDRFDLDGKVYCVSAFQEKGLFSDQIGFQHLARLIRTPGVAVDMSELLGEPFELTGSITEPVLDQAGKNSIRAKVESLNSDIAEAREAGRSDEVGRLMDEKDDILERLKAATGRRVGDRQIDRKLSDDIGRARTRIRNAINAVYKKMRSVTPPLAKLASHLESTVKASGRTYIYDPTGRETPRWKKTS